MVRYTSIKQILNYISPTVKSKSEESILLSWANHFLKANKISVATAQKSYRLTIANSICELPEDIFSIHGVFIVHDETYLSDTLSLNEALEVYEPMKYIGQDKKCALKYVCPTCTHSFSIDNDVSYLSSNIKNAEILMFANGVLLDEEGLPKVEDDFFLLKALAYYAESEYWHNSVSQDNRIAADMWDRTLNLSHSQFVAYSSGKMLREYDAVKHAMYVSKKNKYS